MRLVTAVCLKQCRSQQDTYNADRNSFGGCSAQVRSVSSSIVVVDYQHRDFTINSLFYNVNTDEVEDLTQLGLRDLEEGTSVSAIPSLLQ